MRKTLLPLSLMAVILLVTPSGRPRTDAVRPALQATPAAQGCEADPAGDYTQTISGLVEGDTLELRVSARFGGAVESLRWRGKEFINIWDHGRQIGYAWGMDGYGECLNPTEPGSANDGQGLTSTTQLLSVCRAAENSLSTAARVAYWLAPGQSGGCAGGATTAVNDTVLSDQILEKTVEIGYQGIDNVIAFTALITVPQAYRDNQLEIPTGYLTYEFNNYHLYNPQTGELTRPESQPITGPWSFQFEGNLPPILATRDGAYAMGAYSAEAVRYYSILGTDNPIPADRTNKWNIVVREEPVLGGTYKYRSFVIVGTLDQVQAAMDALYAIHPADFNPPTGWIDVATCQEIAGWAWDPKTPSNPIQIEVHELLEDGTETSLTRMIADQPRGDLVTALGDDGRHGFSIQTSSIVRDSQRHVLRVYAVNSDPALPNRYLYGAPAEIECPGLGPTLEPTAGSTASVPPTLTTGTEAAPATPPGPGGPPCLGAAAMVALSVWIRRKR